jgi:energy-coupling factor transporter ATP-binding protein EcfA2
MNSIATVEFPKDAFVEWFSARPKWVQTAAARLAASRKFPSNVEVEQLVDLCVAEANGEAGVVFETVPEGMLGAAVGMASFKLTKLDKVVGVNAIRHGASLDFGNSELSVVFGMNGSGKSGYARLLKHVCGARHKSDLLPDVFSSTEISPSCEVVISTAAGNELLQWQGDSTGLTRLRSIHVFDTAVADSYVDSKNEASYETRQMRFLTSMIKICDVVAARLSDRKNALPKKLPLVPVEYAETAASSFIAQLKDTTTSISLNDACTWSLSDDELRLETEMSLKKHDVAERIKRLGLEKRNLMIFQEAYDAMKFSVSDAEVAKLVAAKRDAAAKRKAATEDAEKAFADAALDGIGGASWSLLWEQARKYSESTAYPESPFPVTDEGRLCVLCHQPLDNVARARMSDFESFVKGGLEAAATKAEKDYAAAIVKLPKVPDQVKWDLHMEFIKVPAEVGSALRAAIGLRLEAIPIADAAIPLPEVDWSVVDLALNATAEAQAKEAMALEELAKDGKKAELEKKLKELNARRWLSQQKEAVADEIVRLAAIKRLTKAEGTTKTNVFTTKKNELANNELAKGYRDRFVAELKTLGGSRLRVEPVPVPEGKGKISFKLAIKGALKETSANEILSEGENRIVALSAFLADITGSGQPTPFVFDDPVSSLDQEFEERVVERLVELAKSRQVIVFTHRLSLLALIEEAAGKSVPLSINTLRRIGPNVGMVDTLDVRHGKPDKGFIVIRDQKLPQIRKHVENRDAGAYDAALKAACGDFRILIERTVEKILLNGLVERFRRSVQTQQIKSLSKITVEDCTTIEEMMTKYSRFEHSQSDELPGTLPSVDELAADLDVVITWIDGFKKRAV